MKEQEMHDGTINGSHFVTVGKTKEVAKDSIESLLAPYNVPEEVINMLKSQQVAELETLKAFKEQIQPKSLEPKQKYRGVRQDGIPSEFLHKVYHQEIESGVVNSANLKHMDVLLFDSLVKEIAQHNTDNPNETKNLGNYLITKKGMMEKKVGLVEQLFPDVSIKELFNFFQSLTRHEKETESMRY